MASTVSASSLLLFAFLLVAPRARSDVVQDTCRRCADLSSNVNYAFCASSLGSDPRSRDADLRGLGSVALNLLRRQVTSTAQYIIRQISSRKWDQYTKLCLSECSKLYGKLSTTLEDVIPAYMARRYDDVQTWVSAAIANEELCESQFSEREGGVSPLTKQNGDTLQLSAIALGIVSFVKTGSGSGSGS